MTKVEANGFPQWTVIKILNQPGQNPTPVTTGEDDLELTVYTLYLPYVRG